MKNRFVIGIGSQRAGSTLLHRLLSESTSIFMHPVKELHYFDTINQIRSEATLREFSLRQIDREIDRIVATDDHRFIDNSYKCMLRSNKILATKKISGVNYIDLFRPMLMRRELIGETTPEYMLMSTSQANKMADTVGRDATIILLCRDPVKRILSAAKLYNAYNNAGMDEEELSDWIRLMISRESPWIKAQDKFNDFETAISVFKDIFPRFIALSFEEMIRDPCKTADALQAAIQAPLNKDTFINGTKRVSNKLGSQQARGTKLIQLLEERYNSTRIFLSYYFKSTPA